MTNESQDLSSSLEAMMGGNNPDSEARQIELIAEMIEETGIDPKTIYCQYTGAPIGRLESSEWELVWASFDKSISNDEIIDDLYVRVIASSRPSTAWNQITHESLERLRIANPKRVCGYLMGRYYQSRDKAYNPLNRSLDEIIQDGYNRITAFRMLESCDENSQSFKELATMLLMIDSNFDLALVKTSIGIPANPNDLDVSNLDKYVDAIKESYEGLIAAKAKRERQATLQTSWLASGGNRLSRKAAYNSFMEIKPKSKAVKKKEAKAEAENVVTNMLRQLMDGDEAFAPVKPINIEKSKPLGGFKFKLGGGNGEA